MAKTKWSDVVKHALYIHTHKDEYAYFYGAKGQRLTDATMEALWAAEPKYFSRYNAAQKKAIFDYSRGKVGYDCSGFIAAITGCYMYSGAQWEHCDHKTTNLAEGPGGSILYRPGHVGIDIGIGGYYLHFPSEMHSCEMGKISEKKVDWQATGLMSYLVDYDGAINV